MEAPDRRTSSFRMALIAIVILTTGGTSATAAAEGRSWFHPLELSVSGAIGGIEGDWGPQSSEPISTRLPYLVPLRAELGWSLQNWLSVGAYGGLSLSSRERGNPLVSGSDAWTNPNHQELGVFVGLRGPRLFFLDPWVRGGVGGNWLGMEVVTISPRHWNYFGWHVHGHAGLDLQLAPHVAVGLFGGLGNIVPTRLEVQALGRTETDPVPPGYLQRSWRAGLQVTMSIAPREALQLGFLRALTASSQVATGEEIARRFDEVLTRVDEARGAVGAGKAVHWKGVLVAIDRCQGLLDGDALTGEPAAWITTRRRGRLSREAMLETLEGLRSEAKTGSASAEVDASAAGPESAPAP